MARAELTPIFIGIWRYIDFRYVWDKIPYGAVRLPSHIFILSMAGHRQPEQYVPPSP